MVFSNNLLMGAAGQASEYEIDQSIRFNDGDSAYLSRTPSSGGNQRTWTWSAWVKRCALTLGGSNHQTLFSCATENSQIRFHASGDTLNVLFGGSTDGILVTSQVFRDVEAWYHIVVAVDTTQSTASDRCKVYVNGSQVTSFSTETYPAEDYDSGFNNTEAHNIGRSAADSDRFFDGYLAEINWIDGTAKAASDFGETNSNTGQWIPKRYGGSYGTNGFFIDGRDSSDLGDDESGNGNDFSSSGLAAADHVKDSPTNNLPTFNTLSSGAGTLSDGNLQYVGTSSWTNTRLNLLVPDTGKWALRFKTASSYDQIMVGLCAPDSATTYGDLDVNGVAQIRYNTKDGNFVTRVGGSLVVDTGPPTTSAQTFFQILFDMDNGKMGVAADDATSGTFADISTYSVMDLNGSSLSTARQPFALVYSGTDANAGAILDAGQSGWETTVTGFKNLTLANLDDPTIADPKRYFGTLLYTGNGTTGQTVTGLETTSGTSWTPDWVWIKPRSQPYNHKLFDSVRTLGYSLESSTTNAQADLTGEFIGFADGGFQVDDDGSNNINQSGVTHVAWNWEANGGGGSNSDGSITSTVSASATSGFSIIKWTGTAANGTIGHGLGVQPSLFIIKNTATTNSWLVGSTLYAATAYLSINNGDALATGDAAVFNSTHPTSSVINLGTNVGANGSSGTNNMICYAFAEIEGFSKIDSYTGNGSSDGPMVYTGFKPAWVLVKNISSSSTNWDILDSTREPFNSVGNQLFANTSATEASNDHEFDFLSNGFKVRDTSSSVNTSGDTYIYMAFGETPFKTATAR